MDGYDGFEALLDDAPLTPPAAAGAEPAPSDARFETAPSEWALGPEPDRIVRAVAESFARGLARELSRELHAACSVRPVGVEASDLEAAVAGLPPVGCFAQLQEEPPGLIGLDPALTSAVLARRLAGATADAPPLRELTAFELLLLEELVQRVLAQLRAVSPGGTPQLPGRLRLESAPQCLRGWAATQDVVSVRMRVGVDGVEGTLELHLPGVRWGIEAPDGLARALDEVAQTVTDSVADA